VSGIEKRLVEIAKLTFGNHYHRYRIEANRKFRYCDAGAELDVIVRVLLDGAADGWPPLSPREIVITVEQAPPRLLPKVSRRR
jgi:hypothetical protein